METRNYKQHTVVTTTYTYDDQGRQETVVVDTVTESDDRIEEGVARA